MHHIQTKIQGFNVLLARCGYTGEDGFEISIDSENAVKFSEILLKNQDLKPAGF